MKKAFTIILVLVIVILGCRFSPFGNTEATKTPQRATTFPEPPARTTSSPEITDTPQDKVSLDDRMQSVAFVAVGWCVTGSGREIFVMVPDGTWITCVTNSRGDDYDPSWSPDGKKIAFISQRTGNNDIFLMNADGSDQTQLTFSPEDEHYPAFSPDGQRIVFTQEIDGRTHLFVLALDGVEEEQIHFPGYDEVNCKYPSWSPDGDWLVFSCFGGDMKAGIFVSHPDGSGLKLIKAGALHNPVWSPNGKQIAFDGEPGGNQFEVYIMNSDGSGMTRITEHPEGAGGYNKHPAWSPDGTQLIFTSFRDYPDGPGAELFIINIDGSGERQITDSSQTELFHAPFDAVWFPENPE